MPALGLVGSPLPPIRPGYEVQTNAVLVVTLDDDGPVITSSTDYHAEIRTVQDTQNKNATGRKTASSEAGQQLFTNNGRWKFNLDSHKRVSKNEVGKGIKRDTQFSKCNFRKSKEKLSKVNADSTEESNNNIKTYTNNSIWSSGHNKKQKILNNKKPVGSSETEAKNAANIPSQIVQNNVNLAFLEDELSRYETVNIAESGNSLSEQPLSNQFVEYRITRNVQQLGGKKQKFHMKEKINQLDNSVSDDSDMDNYASDDIITSANPSMSDFPNSCPVSSTQRSNEFMEDISPPPTDQLNEDNPELSNRNTSPLSTLSILENESGYFSPSNNCQDNQCDGAEYADNNLAARNELIKNDLTDDSSMPCYPANSTSQLDYHGNKGRIDGDPNIQKYFVDQSVKLSTPLVPNGTLSTQFAHVGCSSHQDNIFQLSDRPRKDNSSQEPKRHCMLLDEIENYQKMEKHNTSNEFLIDQHTSNKALPKKTSQSNLFQTGAMKNNSTLDFTSDVKHVLLNHPCATKSDTSMNKSVPENATHISLNSVYKGNEQGMIENSDTENKLSTLGVGPEMRRRQITNTLNLKSCIEKTENYGNTEILMCEQTNQNICNNYGSGDMGSPRTVNVQAGTGANRQGDECSNNTVNDLAQALNMGKKIISADCKDSGTSKKTKNQMDEASHSKDNNCNKNVLSQSNKEEPKRRNGRIEELNKENLKSPPKKACNQKAPINKRPRGENKTGNHPLPSKRVKQTRLKKLPAQQSAADSCNCAAQSEGTGRRRTAGTVGRRRAYGPALKKAANPQLLKKASCGATASAGTERRSRRSGVGTRLRARQLLSEGAVWDRPTAADFSCERRDWPASGMHERPVWPLPADIHWPPPTVSPTSATQAAVTAAKSIAHQNACDLRVHKALAGCFQVYKDIRQKILPMEIRNYNKCYCSKRVIDIHIEHASYSYFQSEILPLLLSKSSIKWNASQNAHAFVIIQGEESVGLNNAMINRVWNNMYPTVLLNSCFSNPRVPDILNTSLRQFLLNESDTSGNKSNDGEEQKICNHVCINNSCSRHSALQEQKQDVINKLYNCLNIITHTKVKLENHGSDIMEESEPEQSEESINERILIELVRVLDIISTELCTVKRLSRNDFSKYIDLQTYTSVLSWIERKTSDTEVL